MSQRSQNDPVTEGLSCCAKRLKKIALFSGVINVLTLSGSIYMMQVYDRVIPGRNVATLAVLSMMVLGAYALQGYLDAVRSRMLARVAAIFDLDMQRWLYAALISLTLQGASATVVHQPLRDLEQIRGFLSGMGPVAFMDLPWIPLFVVTLLLFHPLIGLVALLGAAAIIGLTLWMEQRSSTSARQASAWITQRQVFAEATRRNADVIRSMGMTGRMQARWLQFNEGAIVENLRSMDVHANLGSAGKVARYILQSAILCVGALLVINDQASAGIMMASSIIMGRALAPIEVILGTWRQLAAARTGMERLRTVLRQVESPDATTASRQRPHRSLTVTDLSVGAPGTNTTIVSNVSMQLVAGSGLALVGPSGSGKTSLAKALIGIWKPSSGVVRLDGIPYAHWHPDEIGASLGYLPQDTALFEGTIADNIARFDPNAPRSAVVEAAMIAGAHELIVRLPRQYDTPVGEAGTTLSAGQRQRVGLARAVFGNPFLVVLDEPNANLDTEGEEALNGCLQSLKARGAIVIVISHRPMALEALDNVMVIVAGRLLAFGSRRDVGLALSKLSNSQARTATSGAPAMMG